MNEDDAIAKAVLSDVIYITLATVSADGMPWNTPVFAAFDEAYHFYWVSASHVRHSQNIRATGRVAIVVYDSTAPANQGRGVYMEATAEEVTDEQAILHALDTLEKRGWKKPIEEVRGASIQRVYAAIPHQMSITSDGSANGQLFDSRAPLRLLDSAE